MLKSKKKTAESLIALGGFGVQIKGTTLRLFLLLFLRQRIQTDQKVVFNFLELNEVERGG